MQAITLVLMVLLPVTLAILFITDESQICNVLVIVCLVMEYGMVQVIIIKTTVVNSNRPEFFVGMLFFISTLGCLLLFNFFV